MKVKLYSGALKLVEKSGVGQAFFHQQQMLELAGVETAKTHKDSYDIVHFNTVFPDSFFGALLAHLRHKKVVYYAHSTMEDFRNSFKGSNLLAPIFRRWIKLCYQTGDVIITPTEYSKQLIKSYGISKPVYALSNGIDTDFFCPDAQRRAEFRKKYKLKDNDKAVISVGHYIERKGIIEYINLARKLPEYKFFWFGYTNLNIVPDNVKRAIENAPANLILPGYVSRDELRDAYCGCDLFDFMSFEETEGIVVLEALACAIPTIVRNIPVYDGWLKSGYNIYKADSDEDFMHLTMKILNNDTPCLTCAGRELARNRSLRTIGQRLVGIYQTI